MTKPDLSGEADIARVFGLEHPIVDVTPDEILSLRPQIEAAIEAKVAEERERIVAWLRDRESWDCERAAAEIEHGFHHLEKQP